MQQLGIPRARRLRRDSTLAERALWTLLRDRRLDTLKFRRQVPIGPYVADFACMASRLVVEVDGGIHRLKQEEDASRDAWFAAEGFRVLRFGNEQVLHDGDAVLAAVRQAAAA